VEEENGLGEAAVFPDCATPSADKPGKPSALARAAGIESAAGGPATEFTRLRRDPEKGTSGQGIESRC
jgi:hypothetical protein